MPVSAGARVAHVCSAVEAGRAFYVDLSAVPVDQRPTVVAQINELVQRASTSPLRKDLDRAPDGSNVSG